MAGSLRYDAFIFLLQQFADLLNGQFQLNRQDGCFAKHVRDCLFSFCRRNILLIGRNVCAVASLDPEHVLPTKLIIDLEDRILVNRQP